MISCTFAYAKGCQTQSAEVELSEPKGVLFLVRNNDRARNALHAWLGTDPVHGHPGDASPAGPVQASIVRSKQTAQALGNHGRNSITPLIR